MIITQFQGAFSLNVLRYLLTFTVMGIALNPARQDTLVSLITLLFFIPLVLFSMAGGFLAGKYSRANPAPPGSRFAEAGPFVPFDRERGYRVVDVLKQVAGRHGASPARVAIAWLLGRPAICSVIIAARKAEQLEDNIGAVDLCLSDEDVRTLDAESDPGVPYPKWMVLQLDTAEDPRARVLYPERYGDGGFWKDLRGTRWSG